MSSIGNTHFWANVYVGVPDRSTLLQIIAHSKNWIEEKRNEIVTYYIIQRPPAPPHNQLLFRIRLACQVEETANQLESFIKNEVNMLQKEGLPLTMTEALNQAAIREKNGLRRFNELRLSFLRILTDFVFQLVGNGEESTYNRNLNQLTVNDFHCIHLMAMIFCLTRQEEYDLRQYRRIPLFQ